MSDQQQERAESVKKLVDQTTEFMKEMTALVVACRLYVEKQTTAKK